MSYFGLVIPIQNTLIGQTIEIIFNSSLTRYKQTSNTTSTIGDEVIHSIRTFNTIHEDPNGEYTNTFGHIFAASSYDIYTCR